MNRAKSFILLFLFSILLFNVSIPPSKATPEPGSTIVLSLDTRIGTNLVNHPGRLSVPVGVAEVGGELFIANFGSDDIEVYDRGGNFIRTAFSSYSFADPTDIESNGTHIFILETQSDRIHIFDYAENNITSFGESGTGTGQISRSLDIFVNDTNIMVLDQFSAHVLIYSHKGQYLSNFSLATSSDHVGITQTEDQFLITDLDMGRVEVYDHSGGYLGVIPLPSGINMDYAWGITTYQNFLLVSNQTSILFFNLMGEYKGNLDLKDNGAVYFGLFEIIENTVYVADQSGGFVFGLDINANDVELQSTHELVRIAWDGITGINQYNIYRGTSSDPFQKIASVVDGSNHYIDELIEEGMTYYYSVTAVNEYGETEFSPPQIITVSSQQDGQEPNTGEQTVGQTVTITNENTITANNLVSFSPWLGVTVLISSVVIIRYYRKR